MVDLVPMTKENKVDLICSIKCAPLMANNDVLDKFLLSLILTTCIEMVIFINLEEEAELSEYWLTLNQNVQSLRASNIEEMVAVDHLNDSRENPNIEKAIAKALGCYPVVKEIASHFDLNTLDALSSTCRQVRANLLQYRTQLIKSTLQCENENIKVVQECSHSSAFIANGQVTKSAGSSKCARDFVGPCQRCGRVVCRNCVIKPPAPALLRYRHRRICKTCSSMELTTLIHSPTRNISPGVSYPNPAPIKLTENTIKPYICRCSLDRIWLCRFCDRSIAKSDQSYESIWKWSSRFLPSLGGLGIGLREGNRGVTCGRGEHCAKAIEVELEIDCDAEDARKIDDFNKNRTSYLDGNPSSHTRPGYHRHEIEGIGGVLKRKLVKLVKVGASVSGWGDEKDAESFLAGELDGTSRSWCSWCQKIIPSKHELEKASVELSCP